MVGEDDVGPLVEQCSGDGADAGGGPRGRIRVQSHHLIADVGGEVGELGRHRGGENGDKPAAGERGGAVAVGDGAGLVVD